MENRIPPWLPRKEQEMGKSDPAITLGDRLRHEASLALEDYLEDLIRLGRTNDESDHQGLERVRLQYFRLLEAAHWADNPDGEPF